MAVFSDQTRFKEAKFANNTKFAKASFGTYANFNNATFGKNTDFNASLFEDRAAFVEASFGRSTQFASTVFKGDTVFVNTNFQHDITFYEAMFNGDADFHAAIFHGRTIFKNTKFKNKADLSRVIVSGYANFTDTTFSKEVKFTRAIFGGNANFERVTFEGNAVFHEASFVKRSTWQTAEFKRYATFEECNWGSGPYNKYKPNLFGPWRPKQDYPVHFSSAFFATRFHGIASFDKALLLKEPSEANAPDARFEEACKAVALQIEADKVNATKDEADTRSPEKVEHEAGVKRWSELSSGYLAIKAAMERAGDFDRAQRYHHYEIEARIKKPNTSPSEHWEARVYARFSDYGASITRPVCWLIRFWVIFALLYLGLAQIADAMNPSRLHIGNHFIPDLLDAFSLSFKNAFLQLDGFGQITSEKMQTSFGGGLISGLARLVGAVQTFLSLILAFLFGLAVRRKFQIR